MSVKIKQDKNAAQIGLQDQNPIFAAWRQLKDSIFNVLFVLLDKNEDQNDQTIFGLIFQSGLDYLQMMVFPFQAAVISVWNGGQTLTSIKELFTKLNVSTYLPGINFSTFLILVYVLIAMIIMVIVDIIYVSYSFSKKKFRFTWPLILLAQIVPLFVTVLFLPITQTLFSVVQCQTNQQLGKQVMSSFPDVVCWQGWHLFHAVITLLFSSIFVFISSIVGIALFQPRMTTNKLTARQNSTGQIVFILNKIVTQFVFSFTPFDNSWIYCIMLFTLSGWLFWIYNMHDPYYEKSASKLFRIASTYYFWTNFMLMVSQILLDTGFNGGLVIWLCGLPFIWVPIVFDKQSNIDKLFSSNLKFRSGEDLQGHLKFVLQLIQNQQKDKNSYMLLIGYIEKHKQICTQEDCPLKVYKKKAGYQLSNKENAEMQQSTIQLIKQLQRMYIMGIKKYPSSTKLRLSFAFFHLERTKNKKKAYEQFSNAEKTDPAFQQQFIIYRFKKIIRQNLEDNNSQNNSDLIQIIRFDNHISLCEEAMVFSGRLHKEFWLQLMEEIPDLKKLNSIGSKITQTVNTVKENYRQIQKINDSVPEVLHNFALYLILIQQDLSQGKQLMMQAKKIYQQKLLIGQQSITKQFSFENIDQGHRAIIITSGKSNSVGKIININLLFIELSGYPKQELAERNLEKVLPECLMSHHQFCINEWLINQDINSQYFNTNNTGFIRHKSGFLIPITYKVKFLPQEQQFITIFEQDSSRAAQCHLITDYQGNIQETSIFGYTYFGFDKIVLSENQFSLSNIGFQHFIFDRLEENIKLGISKDSMIQYAVKAEPIKIKTNNMLNQGDEQQSQFIVKQKQIVGFKVQITKLQKDFNTHLTQNKVELNQQNQQAILDLYAQPGMLEMLAFQLSKTQLKQEYQFINYGQKHKIKTMRLTNNQIKMVYNQDSDDYYDQNRNNNQFQDQYQLLKVDDENFQKKIKKAINTNLNHIQISRLKWISLIFMLLLFTTVIIHLILTSRQLDNTKIYLKTILLKSQQTDFLMRRISNTFAYNFTPPLDPKTQLALIQNHTIQYNYPIKIQLLLQDNSIAYKQIQDAMIFMQSQLEQYAMWKNPLTINDIFYNYINNIFPFLSRNQEKISISLVFSYSLLSITGFLGLAMLFIWIYIMLLIDKKRYNIMIWFLDIPISYIRYLSFHCDKYLKTFVGIKQLQQKRFKLDQKQYHFQGYLQKKDQNQQQIEQQQKTRKSLIARQKKETLLSKINLGYLKFTWVVFYSVLFSTTILITSISFVDVFQFLKPQLIISYQNLLWGGSLNIGFYIIEDYKQAIPNTSTQQFISNIKENYLNMISKNNLIQFQNRILDFSIVGVRESYKKIYLNDMCLDAIDKTGCESLLDGKLKGGYKVLGKFLYQADIERRNQYRIAQNDYSSPGLLNMITSWQQELDNEIAKTLSLSSIIMYIYIIVSLLGFLIVWMLYLKKLNTQINQTIQMLNMIPLKLLPKSRKQTKKFITWIINEANKKQHQQQ